MPRTFVVPLDGSDLAERALPYAVRLAEARQGRLVLVRVALAPPSARIDGADWERLQIEAVQEAQQYLEDVVARLATAVPVEQAVPYGRASVEIVKVVDRVQADTVVMASHGRTGVAHLLHGSVAESILADSPVPVFLVHARPGQPGEAPFDPRAARLLVPLDGSSFAEAAIPTALDLLGTAGELVLVTMVTPPDHVLRDDAGRVLAYLDQQEQTLKAEALEYLTSVANRLQQTSPGVRVRAKVRLGEAAPGIVTVAVDHLADLVVMATHGRTGLTRAVLGSVAGDVLRTGSTPVMLVHPHAALLAEAGAPTQETPTSWIVA